MLAECPVCRAPLRWTYLMRPLGSRWRCAQCESVLAVDGKRRLLAVVIWIPILLLGSYQLTRLGWSDLLAPVFMLVFWVPVFLALDRAAVIERAGLRCRGCGYDLRGQVVPRCPECGRELSEEERRMLTIGVFPTAVVRSRRGAWVVVMLLVALGCAVTLGLAITYYYGTRPPAATPPPAAPAPAAPAPAPPGTRPAGDN